ncbi:MAG: type III-B CRISPR-associated protein Cas10/Cmr2, partial [Nostoc sp.]
NGNILKSTAKFDVFHKWQNLTSNPSLQTEAAIFEQASTLWSQHPAPMIEAIVPWTRAFCDRRDQFLEDELAKKDFQEALSEFLQTLWNMTEEKNRDSEIQNWLKLAAFVKRNREIKLGGGC